MTELYSRDVKIIPDTRVIEITRSGNSLSVTLENCYSNKSEKLNFSQVVGDNGTLPNDELYFELKPTSINNGEFDLEDLISIKPQTIESNRDGSFQLFRVGDAWTSRNLHAAILDAARIAHAI